MRENPDHKASFSPNNSFASKTVKKTHAAADNADQNRITHSEVPKKRKHAAVSQNFNGGLLKQGSPPVRGVSQSPVINISREIMAYSASSPL
ncbi:MAG: hypothetical protein A3J92_07725 [Planctomycetes bacterium RIFOXYC2_FULL_41_27]|nr:MAG: hypothetical protein A3J92_07725 [Planctomycetes bacterium RIFOXYC2_FULL_41_27]